MKSINLIIFMGIIMFSACKNYVNNTIPANNQLIEYTGRIDFSDPLAPKFSYSGVSIRACFKGPGISVILNDEGNKNFYNVILDKKIVMRLQTKPGLNTYLIDSNLSNTIHEIELFRLTEEMFGKTQFCGFELAQSGKLVEITDKRDHLIEFIGNSITCGYGNEGINGQGTFGPETENHYMTYAAITSRAFNARHLAECKSGIGIYRNWDGPAAGNVDCMPNFYDRIYLYDSLPLYDFKEKPDLICIDLGTNDFSTIGGDSALYVNGYLKFIDSLQTKSNGADIICLLGPMLSGEALIEVRGYLNYIVATANSKNQGKVFFFEMSEQNGELGIGIDYHPTVAQHQKNAGELISFIEQLKGWNINTSE